MDNKSVTSMCKKGDPLADTRDVKSSEVTESSEEHNPKTYQQDFWEKYPNAAKNIAGLPPCCRDSLYKNGVVCHDPFRICEDCWNEVMEE